MNPPDLPLDSCWLQDRSYHVAYRDAISCCRTLRARFLVHSCSPCVTDQVSYLLVSAMIMTHNFSVFSFTHQTNLSEDISHSGIYIPAGQSIIQISNLTKPIDLRSISFFCDECDKTENMDLHFVFIVKIASGLELQRATSQSFVSVHCDPFL